MRHGSGLEESWSLVTVLECDDRWKDREATFVVALDLGSIDKVVGFLLSFLEFLDLGSIGVFGFICVEGHLWKAQWKEKPNDKGRKKLTM